MSHPRVLFIAALLSLIAAPAAAKTLTRSCKGGWYLEYEIAGKQYKIGGPPTVEATGTSKGLIPSASKARKRACRDAARKAAGQLSEAQALARICSKHTSDSGRITGLGGRATSKGEKAIHDQLQSPKEFKCSGGKPWRAALCGDGVRTGAEECDDGPDNSDSRPNACRTDCTKASCGDYVTDSGEQCDNGRDNDDEIPGACRTNCKKAQCGDGVVDFSKDEVCDDGNRDPNDGCHQCQACYVPKNNMAMRGDVTLCTGSYRAPDSDNNGALVLSTPGVTLDCQGARILGSGKRGIGIVITAANVVVRGCNVSGYGTGIDVRAPGAVVFDNQLCNNAVDVKASKTPIAGRNHCNSANGWNEGGKNACSQRCR